MANCPQGVGSIGSQSTCQARCAKKPRSVTVNWRVTRFEWDRVSLWNRLGSWWRQWQGFEKKR